MAELTWRLLVTALIISFGSSFQSGYFVSLYNVPEDIIEKYINTSLNDSFHVSVSNLEISTIWAAIASSNQAGKLIAVFLTPLVADRFGRRRAFFYSHILSISGIVLQYAAQPTGQFVLLAVGRFLSGSYVGIVGVLVPLFLVEIAVVPSLRASVTRMHNIAAIVGNIVSFVLGVPQLLGTAALWGYLALIPLPLIVLETAWLKFIPESPLYLIQQGDSSREEAQRSLRFYLGPTAEVELESPQITTITHNVSGLNMPQLEVNPKPKSKSKSKPTRNRIRPSTVTLWLMLALASSFSGGNVTMNFLTSMVADGDAFSTFHKYASVIINSAKILFVLLALYAIDRYGRRPLLIWTLWPVFGCYVALTALAFVDDFVKIPDYLTTFATWSHLVFLFFLTSIQYVVNSTATLIVSEMAVQRTRAMALSIFKAVYHLTSIGQTLAWPPLVRVSEGGAYVMLMAPYLAMCLYLTVKCPETKDEDFVKMKKATGDSVDNGEGGGDKKVLGQVQLTAENGVKKY